MREQAGHLVVVVSDLNIRDARTQCHLRRPAAVNVRLNDFHICTVIQWVVNRWSKVETVGRLSVGSKVGRSTVGQRPVDGLSKVGRLQVGRSTVGRRSVDGRLNVGQLTVSRLSVDGQLTVCCSTVGRLPVEGWWSKAAVNCQSTIGRRSVDGRSAGGNSSTASPHTLRPHDCPDPKKNVGGTSK